MDNRTWSRHGVADRFVAKATAGADDIDSDNWYDHGHGREQWRLMKVCQSDRKLVVARAKAVVERIRRFGDTFSP